jgi:hypothetical protein
MLEDFIRKNKIIYKLARSFYSQYSYVKYRKILSRNKELKDKYAGKRCFVIGNGSSINQQDLTKLENEYCFVCNRFCLHENINQVKPNFYSMIEPIRLNLFFREKMFPTITKEMDFCASENKKTIFLLNIQHKNYIETNKLFSGNKIYYFLFNGLISKKMHFDMTKPNPAGTASIYFLLSLAKYMGFKKIYIIGCDHDYILHKDEKHFYQESFGNVWKGKSNLELAQNLSMYLERMSIINSLFLKQGVQIFNAGLGGLTDVFPRINYDSLFKK